MVDCTRWGLVRDLRERRHEFDDDRGTTWEKCYSAVSEELKGTIAAGGSDAIKASYNHVQQALKNGQAGYFDLNIGHAFTTLIGKRR